MLISKVKQKTIILIEMGPKAQETLTLSTQDRSQ